MKDDRYKEHEGMKVRTFPRESQQCLLGEKKKKMQCLYEIFSVIEDYRRKILSPGAIVGGGA